MSIFVNTQCVHIIEKISDVEGELSGITSSSGEFSLYSKLKYNILTFKCTAFISNKVNFRKYLMHKYNQKESIMCRTFVIWDIDK